MSLHRVTLPDVRRLLKQAVALELSAGAVLRLKWFLYACEHDGNVSLTCRHFGIARTTLLRWMERFDASDISTLEEESRRPHTVRAPETDTHVIELIRVIRQEQPTLGKLPIQQLLMERHGMHVSASTIGRIITRHQLFFGETPAHERKRINAQEPTEHETDTHTATDATKTVRPAPPRSVSTDVAPTDGTMDGPIPFLPSSDLRLL
jgi:transposase-like protein